jgi:hypothetical protein
MGRLRGRRPGTRSRRQGCSGDRTRSALPGQEIAMPRSIPVPHPLRRLHFAWRRAAIIDVYNILLATLLALSPWLFAYPQAAMRLDAWVSSAAVLALALAAIVTYAEWQEWAAVVMGVWLMVSPWVLGFADTHAMFIDIAIGVLVAYDAALELWVVRSRYSA